MKTINGPSDAARARLDVAKLFFLALTLVGVSVVFVLNPALSTPTLLSMVFSMLLSPWVASLERRGMTRLHAIVALFAVIAIALGGLGYWATQTLTTEWLSFKLSAPQHFERAIGELRKVEADLATRIDFVKSLHLTDSVLELGRRTGNWFAQNSASWVASLLMWLIFVPPLTFIILNDGRAMRRRFFDLVPNRYFESFFLMSNEITGAISDYLRAKLVEALLVGLMTTIGLIAVGAPYAFVLGLLAGLTNILPYIGPVIGAAPGLLIAFFDPSGMALLLPVTIVYVVVNVIDTVVIFPIIVAKLVNLHPLLLLAVVAIGQQYYGLIGMLISIPIASACKVIICELHTAIYGDFGPVRPSSERESA